MTEKITIGRVIFYLEPKAATLINRFLLVSKIQLKQHSFNRMEEIMAELFLDRLSNDLSPITFGDVKKVIQQTGQE